MNKGREGILRDHFIEQVEGILQLGDTTAIMNCHGS